MLKSTVLASALAGSTLLAITPEVQAHPWALGGWGRRGGVSIGFGFGVGFGSVGYYSSPFWRPAYPYAFGGPPVYYDPPPLHYYDPASPYAWPDGPMYFPGATHHYGSVYSPYYNTYPYPRPAPRYAPVPPRSPYQDRLHFPD